MKLPVLVAKMCGIEIEEYISMPVDQDNCVQFGLPDLEDEFPASVWADVIEPKGAEVIAWHTQDFYAGKPAATINRFEKGKVIYLGVMGDSAYYLAIAHWISELAGVESLMETPSGVGVVCVSDRWPATGVGGATWQADIAVRTATARSGGIARCTAPVRRGAHGGSPRRR